jgi:hypothetical protein
MLSSYCNGFDQRVARQQLCKHGPTCNNGWGCVFYVARATPVLVTDRWTRSLTRDTCFLCGLRYATIERLSFLCVVRAERISEDTGMGLHFTWVPKFHGNSSVARRRIRGRVWRHMCCSISILGVCNLVSHFEFLCFKSVARKRILKTSGNRLRRLVCCDCKLCKSAIA